MQYNKVNDADDGGFFLAGKDFRGRFNDSFPACTFFFKVEISLHTPVPLFLGQDQSSLVRRGETTGGVFPDEFCVGSFT